MKYLRYRGEFLSVAGTVWRAEIWQEADAEFGTIGALEFDADEPLVIEWSGKSKEEVICGSAATLKIVSPGDRTYEDLYSIEVGRVRLDVYRDNTLYWSGCLDTEFYEEPYEQAYGYTVTLSFADFGVLDRLKFDLAGMQTIEAIVAYAIGRSGISYGGIEQGFISTKLTPTGGAMLLGDLQVRADNFYDEDGEASTLGEVVTGVLQPLALRMVQRGGKVYIYDLNALHESAPRKQIEWDGDSQTMGVDVVYNNATITWSPYVQEGNLLPEACWPADIKTDPTLVALNNLEGKVQGDAQYFSYHAGKEMWDLRDDTDSGFTLWLSERGDGVELIDNRCKFFKIVPQNDGTESEGIALRWVAFNGRKYMDGRVERTVVDTAGYGITPDSLAGPILNLYGVTPTAGGVLFRSKSIWLPPVDNPKALLLRVRMDLLMDPRANPFEEAENFAEDWQEKDWHDLFKSHANAVYAPVSIKYKPAGSDVIYVWSNRDNIEYRYKNQTTLSDTLGSWQAFAEDSNGADPYEWGYLSYYDAKNLTDESGVLGWKSNRPALGRRYGALTSAVKNAEPGQYIPYPNFGGQGGEVWVEVREKGWYIADAGTDYAPEENGGGKNLWSKVSWLLATPPEVEILNNNTFSQAIDTGDVEYSAEINPDAKEPIEIDTICGTSKDNIPTARGAYFDTTTGLQIRELTRAGRTSQAEDLLIGTLYSQYAQRRTKLSGEAVILRDPMAVYIEANQEGKVFLATEDVQDVRMDCSEAVFVELRPDEYKRTNE